MPVEASRSSSAVKRCGLPISARKAFVTWTDASKAGSSEGKRLPSASQSRYCTCSSSGVGSVGIGRALLASAVRAVLMRAFFRNGRVPLRR
jgi:hypothetical protein